MWPNQPSPESILGIMGALLLMIFSTGCISINTHEQRLRDTYLIALKKADFYIEQYGCLDGSYLIRSKIAAEEMRPK